MAIPLQAPTSFFSGDTVQWLESHADYAPADGWTLTADFSNADRHVSLASLDNGDGKHLMRLGVAESSLFVAGDYTLGVSASNSAGDRFTVYTQDVQVKANLANATDGRSQVKKDLDALNAWVTSRDVKVAEYQIAGRSMKYFAPMELETLRNARKREYQREQNVAALARGERPKRRRLLSRMRG